MSLPSSLISLSKIQQASFTLKGVIGETPLHHHAQLSQKYGANILLKREDLQTVRSYKIRGAYTKINSLSDEEKKQGIVCASAGNHAQGVAYSCASLGIKGTIFMPIPTPKQKIRQVRMFGHNAIEVVLVGDTFDDAFEEAMIYSKEKKMSFIHPFDDESIIAGQGTVGLEILNQATCPIDYLIVPVGGGGLISGLLSVFKVVSPKTKVIGIEPKGAPAMFESLQTQSLVTLSQIDKFIDGAAVRTVGKLNFEICNDALDEMLVIEEGAVCRSMLDLYDSDAIVVEPAGALSISILECIKDRIQGKTVVCVVSGGNNDITRTAEIRERALLYEGLKHYFIVRFAQRAGALREFVNQVLGPNDDIVHFEYHKKNDREKGSALVGIELQFATDFEPLKKRLDEKSILYTYLNDKPDLFEYLV